MKRRYYPVVLNKLMWAFSTTSKQVISDPKSLDIFTDETNKMISLALQIHFRDVIAITDQLYITKSLSFQLMKYYLKALHNNTRITQTAFKAVRRILREYISDQLRFYKSESVICKPDNE